MFHLHKLNLSTLSLEPGTSGIYPVLIRNTCLSPMFRLKTYHAWLYKSGDTQNRSQESFLWWDFKGILTTGINTSQQNARDAVHIELPYNDGPTLKGYKTSKINFGTSWRVASPAIYNGLTIPVPSDEDYVATNFPNSKWRFGPLRFKQGLDARHGEMGTSSEAFLISSLYVYIHIYIRYIHVQIQFVMYSNTYQSECTHSIFGIVNFANVWCSRHNVKSNTSLGWICLTRISCSEAICIREASTSQGAYPGVKQKNLWSLQYILYRTLLHSFLWAWHFNHARTGRLAPKKYNLVTNPCILKQITQPVVFVSPGRLGYHFDAPLFTFIVDNVWDMAPASPCASADFSCLEPNRSLLLIMKKTRWIQIHLCGWSFWKWYIIGIYIGILL